MLFYHSIVIFISTSILVHAECNLYSIDLKQLNEPSYDNWPKFSLFEKLPYLLSTSLLQTMDFEFKNMQADTSAVTENAVVPYCISREAMHLKLFGLQTTDYIEDYFNDCDTNHDNEIDFLEFIVCRSSYDGSGNKYDNSEFDILESIILHDYETLRNDPSNKLGIYKFDENGIIID